MTIKDEDHPSQVSVARQIAVTYTYVATWIALSGTAVMYNKYILAYAHFPFPITLTMWHMFFCSALAILLVKSGRVQAINMTRETYAKAIVPIAGCYACTLWAGNAAYIYLSVSFIQMLKALMPVLVFSMGCLLRVDKFSCNKLTNMLVVAAGVAIASAGELNFKVVGVLFQMGSLASESIRLVLVQILLQSRGLKLNPITTLYFVAPCCFAFLLAPWLLLEASKLWSDPSVVFSPFLLVTNAMVAFGLNLAVFLLIGKTSALTMNIAGVAKDWMLIGLSVWLYKSATTTLQLCGYFIAFLGICWYNYQKLQVMQQEQAKASQQAPASGEEEVQQHVPEERLSLKGARAEERA